MSSPIKDWDAIGYSSAGSHMTRSQGLTSGNSGWRLNAAAWFDGRNTGLAERTIRRVEILHRQRDQRRLGHAEIGSASAAIDERSRAHHFSARLLDAGHR